MILAAGHGSRLQELGRDRPKPMLPVGTRTLVEHAFSFLKQGGIRQVVINSFTHADSLEDHVGDGSRFDMQVQWSRETGQILGTGGGIRHARRFFEGHTLVVMNGKIVTSASLHNALECHQKQGNPVTLVLRQDPEASRWGGFTLDEHGQVQSMLGISRQGDGTPPPLATHMFTGISILEPEFLAVLPEGPHCLVREGLVPWFRPGASMGAYVLSSEEYWWDHSTPARYLQGNMNLFEPHLKQFFTGDLPYHPSRPDVLAAPGVELPADVTVSGPVVLGKDVRVLPGVHLDRVVAWEGALIEKSLSCAVVTGNQVVPVDLSDPGARTGPALKK